MSETLTPTAEEHELLLKLGPIVERRGGNVATYGDRVKYHGRRDAQESKAAQETLAVIRPILEERDRLRGALIKVVASLSYHEALAVAQGALTETARAER